MEKASLCLCSHSGPTLQAILLQAVKKWTAGWNVSQSVRNVNKMCFLRVKLIKQSYCIGQKSDISLIVFFPGSAETNAGWGGKLNLMPSYVRNICTKNYQNLMIGFQVTVENVRDVFLRHSVYKKRWENDAYSSACVGSWIAIACRRADLCQRHTGPAVVLACWILCSLLGRLSVKCTV